MTGCSVRCWGNGDRGRRGRATAEGWLAMALACVMYAGVLCVVAVKTASTAETMASMAML